ncbi:MAG TPA: tetratricopeptide repeat protein [Deltaproteobacteria bacterium]|nr:tetratricopeptide repeat protein [Deltaproteobacteria bacterium]
MEKDRLADAEKLFQAALSHVPAAPRTLQQYAALLFRQGKPGEAKDLLTQAIQADPSNAELHNDLGAVCHVSGDTAGAISHLEEALRIDPDCAPALKNLAEVLLENNQVEKAREVCRRLRSIYPDDVEASTLWDTFSRGPGEPEGEDSPSPAAHSPARTASRKRPEGLMCLMPFTTMTLSFLGVYNCACPDWIKTKIGDMGASSIADIWNSEQAQWIRSKMYEGNWKEICNWFCPHVINHEKTGRLYRYDELEAHDAVTPQLAEEIRQGKTRLDSSPAVFKLDNSQICNLSCIMCSRSFYREDPVLLEKTTEDLRRHLPGARRIVMSGFGDPLARPDTRSLLMDEGLGHLKFDLITNALLLPRFWDRIRHQNFGDLLVSIDAADKKTYETIRRGGVWEDLLESLSLIGENREKFDSVTLNMTVMRENYASIPAFIDFALSRGFKASFQRIRGPYPRQNIFDLPDEDALRTLRSIVDHELTVRDRSLVFFGDLVAPDEHAPATAEALHQEAVQLFEQGMLAEAIVAMERAVAGGPDNAVLLNDLGAMYHASGEGEKARACFEQATGIDPAYAPSLKNLIELLFADGQYDRARRMCARLLSSHPGDTEARALWADITSAPAADLDTDTANSIQRNRVQWSNYEWTEGGDEWSACWGGTEQLWKRTIQPRIASFLPAAHILEIAPGFGRCTQYLVPQCTKLTLVDLTEKCIEACRRRFRGHSHIRYFVNDGKSLDMLEDGSIDFAFSWDSLVHVEKDVMRSYLHELAAKLRPGGAGFLHHSNIGAFLDPATGKLTVENRHWRGENMSAQLFRDYCQEAGLKCVSQEILAWGGTVLNDCISVFVKEPGYDPKKTVVVENPDFMEESRGRKTPPDVYGPGRSQQHEAASVELGKSGETPGEGALHGGNAPCLLSIILPVKTGTDRAVRSIKSLLRGMPRNAVEIIVVAGAPGDPADDRLERLSHERLTVVIPEGPLTQVQGCGLAVQKASGRFLALADDSVLFSKAWLPGIMKAIEDGSGWDAVTGRTITAGGAIVEAGSSTPGTAGLEGRGLGNPLHDPAYSYSCPVESGSRHCMLVSRQVWDDMNGLDAGLEDLGPALVDLGLRMVSRGFKILYQPQCILVVNDAVSPRPAAPAALSPEPEKLSALRPGELSPGVLKAVPCSGRMSVLVLGIYLANTLNTVTDLVSVFKRSGSHTVVQKWVALNGSPPDGQTAEVTVRELTGRFPKFQIMNDLLAGEDLSGYDYVILCDDDVVLPEGFVDSFIALQDRLGFAIAQPARTLNSYIDHPIVEQHIGVHARQTLFVEIGPVVSFHRSAFGFVFPFDLTSPMGWGYENVWAREVLQRGLKMGIIDAVCVDHSLRKPVAHYDWEQADAQRNAFLERHDHLSLDECFTVLNAHLLAEEPA